MIYLVAIFCSPLALLFVGKPLQAVINLLIYMLSVIFWLTIILHTIGFVLWAVGVTHAVLTINNHREEKRTRRAIAAMDASRRESKQ